MFRGAPWRHQIDSKTVTLLSRMAAPSAVADGEALRRAVDEHRPDVAIIYVRMPPTHRRGTARRLGHPPPGQHAGRAHPAGTRGALAHRPGRSNAAIAAALFISPKVVEKHVANIFGKLGLIPDDNDNRRVIAALRYLES